MKKVTMYTTGRCPYCVMAERLLNNKPGVEIEKIRIDQAPEKFQEMLDRTGRRTVPQIFIGDHHVGGFQDLAALQQRGQLEQLLDIKEE